MASRVTTNIVVEFGEGVSDLFMMAEVDGRDGGLNSGRTSFIPGDSVGILLFKDDRITKITTELTAGTLSKIGKGTFEVKDEIVVFTDDNEARMRYPIDANFVYKWIGVDRGNLAVTDGLTIRKSIDGIGVAKISYTAEYTAYRLHSPLKVSGEDQFTIVVLFVGNE